VKTVANRYRRAAYHNKHLWQDFWIYQNRWFWMTLNPQKGVFSEFSTIFGCSAHINSKLWWMVGDRPRQPLYEIFSINVDFSSSGPDPGTILCPTISWLETRSWSTSYHLDPSYLSRHGNISDRRSTAGRRSLFLATNRNGGMLQLNTSRRWWWWWGPDPLGSRRPV